MRAKKRKGRARGPKRRNKAADANAQLVVAAARKKGIPIPEDTFSYLTPEEKAQRRLFVAQFIKDFDLRAACIRMGHNYYTAKSFGTSYLQCSFVQTFLDEIIRTTEEDSIVSRSRIMFGLLKEAQNSFFAADRIKAWIALAKLKGMDVIKPAGMDNMPGTRGGVMTVPLASIEEWTVAAATQQEQLKADVRK